MSQLTNEYILRVAKEFFNTEKIIDIQSVHGGHINSTYMIVFPDCRYILQQINHYVFNSPISVMNNMLLITNHMMKKCIYDGKSRNRAGLNLVPTRYDQYIAIVDDNYWRCTEFIEGGICYEHLDNAHIFREVGKAVGNFHYMLNDFHSRLIDDPIKNFHNTPKRFELFRSKVFEISRTNPDLIESVKDEVNFIMKRSNELDYITKRLEDHTLKRRVCHNDTKLSNVMMDEKTGKFMCLIDLDTAMKGAIAYDYGDALRGGASTALEDEVDLDKVKVNLELVRSFTRGFLYEMKPKKDSEGVMQDYISPVEVESLYYGFHIIAIELGMRFLDDYISGDLYFRIDPTRPKHNLERARNQLKLAEEVEKNKANIIHIINCALKDYEYREEYYIEENE